jgi:hypothetical protein
MAQTFCHRSSNIRDGKNILLILITVIATIGCRSNKEEIQILFVGDILLSRNVKEEIQKRKDFPWNELFPLFQASDLVVGNLEGAVGNPGDAIYPEVTLPVFGIEETDITLLKKAGFHAISIENNHILDLGYNGKTNTVKALQSNQISPVFFDNSPRFFTIKDVVISLVALNRVYNRDSTRNEIPSIQVKQKLQLARALSNVVIVSIHWGSELLEWPNKEQREIAKWLIEQGADVIIGSHPHVVQQPEIIDGKPVFFSLGNHLFDQKYPETKKGLIADIRIRNDKLISLGIGTHTKQNSFYPEISHHIDYNFKPVKISKVLFSINNRSIKPFSIPHEENKIILQAFKGDKKVWNSHPLPLVSINTLKIDGEKKYLFTLENHFSSLDGKMDLRPYVYEIDNHGIFARWRGSALAWPLIDASFSSHDPTILCALHSGNSFIARDYSDHTTRIAAYKWNGFGFSGLDDSVACINCVSMFKGL